MNKFIFYLSLSLFSLSQSYSISCWLDPSVEKNKFPKAWDNQSSDHFEYRITIFQYRKNAKQYVLETERVKKNISDKALKKQ